MTTGTELISRSLRWLGVSSHLMPADPEQESDVWMVIQSMFDLLPQKNIFLEIRRPLSPSSDLLEPSWAKLPLICAVAYYSANHLRVSLDDQQIAEIDSSFAIMRNKAGKPVHAYENPYRNHEWIYYYPGQNREQIEFWDIRSKGEIKKYRFDFTEEATRRGATLSSVVVENAGVEDATIESTSTSGNITTTTLTFPDVGRYLIRATGTFASGEKYQIFFQIETVDQESYYRATESS